MAAAHNPEPKTYSAELRALLERGHAGDPSVLPELKKAFDENPELADMLGDLGRLAAESLVTAVAGRSLVAREAIRRRADKLRRELAEPDAPVLERLLAERIAMGWIEVHKADADLAVALGKQQTASDVTQAANRHLDRAHARYLSSIKALATVRKLLQPRPSPADLLKPVDEQAPVGHRSAGASRRCMAGVG
jgi:hypothetical protein